MRKTLFLSALIALLSGCTFLTEQAAKVGARAIAEYCETESPEARAAYRAAWSEALTAYGHSVRVQCGDSG